MGIRVIADEEWSGYAKKNRKKNPHDRRNHHQVISRTAPFLAYDGEGYSTPDGDHHYMLFGNKNECVKGRSLTWRECFPLIAKNGGIALNVIYSGRYDMVMMLKHMERNPLERIMSGRPKWIGKNRLRYLKGKFADIRIGPDKARLYDVFSFFQTSFVKACVEYLGDDETLQEIARVKQLRDSFEYGDESVEDYWRLELEYLERLMTKLRELLAQIGIHPRGWYGPGVIADALYSQHKMRRWYGGIPEEVIDVAEHAYYGGRFEQFKLGVIDNVYEYDIRSAYPAAIAQLPDFSNCEWKHSTEEYEPEKGSKLNRYGLYKVSWRRRNAEAPGPFPWREFGTGRIYYPMKGVRSWYWGVEVNAYLANRLSTDELTVHEAWIPHSPTPHVRPFEFVPEMYEQRAQMKRDDNPAQKALKLALNSLYGKLAQSVGATFNQQTNMWKKPPWHHVLWAGWITARSRATLMEAIGFRWKELVSIETDAIFTTQPWDHLSVSEALGDWELTTIDQMISIHSGVYYALKDGKWDFRSRGTEADSSKTPDQWLQILARAPFEDTEISHKLVRFGTDMRNENFGRWFPMTINGHLLGSKSKRMHLQIGCRTCWDNPNDSCVDKAHILTCPSPSKLECDVNPSSPYPFPWREPDFEWDETAYAEIIFDQEGVQWH